MLASLVAAKCLSMLYKIIFEQSSMDIFAIDWETPKLFVSGSRTPKLSVSPWRRLFIINKFNRLQTQKHVTPEWLLLLFLVIMEGFGYKYYALMEARLTREPSDSPENFVLNFVVITCVVYGLGCLKYFMQMLTILYYP